MEKRNHDYIGSFITYLRVERNASASTIQAYTNDIKQFLSFLHGESINSIDLVDHRVVRVYITNLHSNQLSRKTISRKLSSLRSFFKFLERETVVSMNPFSQIS